MTFDIGDLVKSLQKVESKLYELDPNEGVDKIHLPERDIKFYSDIKPVLIGVNDHLTFVKKNYPTILSEEKRRLAEPFYNLSGKLSDERRNLKDSVVFIQLNCYIDYIKGIAEEIEKFE